MIYTITCIPTLIIHTYINSIFIAKTLYVFILISVIYTITCIPTLIIHTHINSIFIAKTLSCSHTYTDLGGGSAAQEYGRWSAILRQLP